MNLRLRETGDLWGILFAPKAQGTIRPLSERAFFLVFHGLFGLNALPFRVTVFLTQFANLALLSSITWRITRSRAAGFWAPVLWVSNSALVIAMSWTSAYNQVLCAFFLLASFQLLLLHIETGKLRYYVWQWVTFLLGFGALEIIIVYPAIAATYAFLRARRYFRRTLWLIVPSAAYAVLHWRLAPGPGAGVYALHLDASMLATFERYWEWALSPWRYGLLPIDPPHWVIGISTILLTVGIAVFLVCQFRRRNWLAAFPLLWFVFLIAPVLPLRDHRSDYYLTTPLIGLAILGAWALVEASKTRWYGRTAAALLVTVYLAGSLPMAIAVTRWNYEQSRAARNLVRGLVRARELHPGKLILLTDVDEQLFWGALYPRANLVAGVGDVYLAPGSENGFQARPKIVGVSDYVLSPALTLRALVEDRAVVYSAKGERLRNVTTAFRSTARARWREPEMPERIEVGSTLFAVYLGPTWYAAEGTYRWMPKRATVTLHGPCYAAERLYLSGQCPARLVQVGPLGVSVRLDGVPLGQVRLTKPDSPFDFSLALPPNPACKPRVEVTLEVERTVVIPPDVRELGLAVSTIAIR